jgi:peptidyl-dipeptidase Dcp
MKTTLLLTAAALALSACASTYKGREEAERYGSAEGVVHPPRPTAAVSPELAAARDALRSHPLLVEWTGPYGGVPPFDRAKPELFPDAFRHGIELRRAEIQAIVDNPEPPTFQNTSLALMEAGRPLGRALTVFGVMTSSTNTPEYQALDKEWSPKLAAASDEITFNDRLFQRIKAVYEARETSGLTPEQKRIVERSYRAYVRGGAELNAEQKAELGRINQRLAALFSDFSSKVLNDEDAWTVLDGEADLAGLPESLKASYKAAAEARNLPGKWAVVNTRSSVDPFLTFSSRRDLREKVWRAFVDRGDNKDAEDTNATVAEIVKLRADRARLLGFPTHAHWRMDDTMAKDPAAANALMQRVWPAAVARVREEVADMQKVADREARRRADRITIEPWDYRYYAEKVRKARYDLDQNEIKPYLELNNVIDASYWMAEELYGLSFKEVTGTVPTFHPDVRVYEVYDAQRGGRQIGLFFRDDFARTGKRSGAWHSLYRVYENYKAGEPPVLVVNSNNNNFTKAAAGEPVLISLDDAETLFHEFGHAIHFLVSEVEYPALAATPRDYVEYPSQVHENWLLTRPVIERFLKHYRTGEPMPEALVDKIEASSKFNQGFATVEYLASAIVDMELHTRPDGLVDPDAFERETLERIGMPDEIVMRHRLPHFNHLFTSDAYSAGYYSYLWSDVMAADTWAAFEETGNVFDPELAAKMREHVMASGNEYDRAEAFRRFRGRDPQVEALLEQRGFPTK